MKSAYGLFDACLRAFSLTFAKVSRFVPYFQRYSRPAPPNICAVGRRLREALHVDHHLRVLGERVLAVVVLRPERALLHLLEADDEHALGDAALDRLLAEHQRGRAGRAVVVHVEDRDAGEPDLVDRALAARAVAVDVAGVRLLDVVVRDLRVLEGGRAPPSTPSRGSPRSARAWRTSSSRRRSRSLVEPSHSPPSDQVLEEAELVGDAHVAVDPQLAVLVEIARLRRGPCTGPRGPRRRCAGPSRPSRRCPRAPRRRRSRSTTQLAFGLVTLNWRTAPTSFARPGFLASRSASALKMAGAVAVAGRRGALRGGRRLDRRGAAPPRFFVDRLERLLRVDLLQEARASATPSRRRRSSACRPCRASSRRPCRSSSRGSRRR